MVTGSTPVSYSSKQSIRDSWLYVKHFKVLVWTVGIGVYVFIFWMIMKIDRTNKYDYCPNGNYRKEISWVFDKRIFLFCDCKVCNNKVYELRPVDITSKVSQEQLEEFVKRKRCEIVRKKVNYKNMYAVETFLASQT